MYSNLILLVIGIVLVSGCVTEVAEERPGGKEEPAKEEVKPKIIEWTPRTSPPGGGVWSITISPSNPESIYAATRDLNLLKSTDGGESWVQKGERRLGAHVFSNIAVDPNDPDRVYASNGRLHISDDGGDTWRSTEIGSDDSLGIVGIAVSPSDTNIIYVHDDNGDVHRSIDRGQTWNKVDKIQGEFLSSIIVVDPTTSDTVYIVTKNNERGVSRILKSTDGAQTFTKIIEPGHIRALVINPKNPTELHLSSNEGVFKTSNSGKDWQRVRNDQAAPLAISRSNPDILIYGSDQGHIYKSSNGGDDWSLLNSINLHDWANFDIEIDSVNPEIVYIGTEDGFLKSLDGGISWKEINNGVVDDGIFTLAIDPKNSDRVFVGNFWTRGVFLTEDRGSTWELLREWRHTQVPDHYPMEIVLNPKDSNETYITGEYGLKKSSDGGKTWTSLGGDLFYGKHVHGLDIDPSNPDILYVGSGKGEVALEGTHVFKTTDGGKTWEDMADGFPTNEEANVYVISIATSNPDIVYVGTNSHEFVKNPKPTKGVGIYKTIDGGKTWQAVNNGLLNKNVFALAVDPLNPDIVYVGTGHEHNGKRAKTHNDGLYRTTDGGESWGYVRGLPQAEVSHIEFHPKNSSIILVSFGENKCAGCGGMPEGRGIYATIDGGENWYFVSDGFTERQQVVMDVIFDSRGDIIYAGTDDGFITGKLLIK